MLFSFDLLLLAAVFQLAESIRIQFIKIKQYNMQREPNSNTPSKDGSGIYTNKGPAPVSAENVKLEQVSPKKAPEPTATPKANKTPRRRFTTKIKRSKVKREMEADAENQHPGGFYSKAGMEMLARVKRRAATPHKEDSVLSAWSCNTESECDTPTPVMQRTPKYKVREKIAQQSDQAVKSAPRMANLRDEVVRKLAERRRRL